MHSLKSPYTQGCLAQEAQQLCKRLGDSKAMANTLVLLAEVRGCHGGKFVRPCFARKVASQLQFIRT